MDWPELRTLLKTLMLPPASPLCVIALGLLLSALRPRTGRALAAIGLAAAWLTATWGLADRLFAGLEAGQRPLDETTLQQAMRRPDPPQAVVVVSMGARRDGLHEPRGERLLTRSLERAVAAARVAKLSGLPVYVQGFPDTHLQAPAAELMRRTIEQELGAPVRWVDTAASVGHAEIGRRVAEVLAADGIRSVIASTHAHNMPRLRPALEAAGLAVLPAPHSFRTAGLAGFGAWLPNADAMEANMVALYEWAGLWSYRLPGRALGPPEAPRQAD